MYSIRMTGPKVSVSGPNNEVYNFGGGYGNYDMIFSQEEVAAVCQILEGSGVFYTSASLTDCVSYIRNRPQIGASNLLT